MMFRTRSRFSFVTFVLLLLAACNQAAPPELTPQATTTVINDQTSCVTAGGTFNGPGESCTLNSYTIAEGDTLELVRSATLGSIRFNTLANNGTLRVLSAGFNAINAFIDSSFSNTGTVEVSSNLATISGTVSNAGTFNVKRGGNLDNFSGTLTNSGTLTVESGGNLSNRGTLTNSGTLAIGSGGNLDNPGTLINTGTLTLACGSNFQGRYEGNEPVRPAECIRPIVTLSRATTQTDASVIVFTAVFSELVTGFENTDISVGGTAGATSTIVGEVAPNDGTTYTVSVGGMSQTGTVVVSIRDGAAQDAAGNLSTASNEVTATYTAPVVDSTAPVIALTTPADGTSYKLKQRVNAAYSCTDEGSGVASCTGTVANGAAIDTASVGHKSFTVAASDSAGNTSSKTVTYRVIYDFKGFFYPVKNAPALNLYKAGLPVPFSFTLGGNYGRNVLSSVKSVPINCKTLQPLGSSSRELTSLSTQADSRSLSAQSSTIYLYLWQTQRAWKGTCREFTLALNDSTDHKANFKFN